MPKIIKVRYPSQQQSELSTLSTYRPNSTSLNVDNNSMNLEKRVRKNFFPKRLMEMLSSPFFSDCAAWTSEETAFFIMDPEKLMEKHSSFYKCKHSQIKKSLTRKLNRWGFKMDLARGPKCGSYSHPLFRKDKPLFERRIKRFGVPRKRIF